MWQVIIREMYTNTHSKQDMGKTSGTIEKAHIGVNNLNHHNNRSRFINSDSPLPIDCDIHP